MLSPDVKSRWAGASKAVASHVYAFFSAVPTKLMHRTKAAQVAGFVEVRRKLHTVR